MESTKDILKALPSAAEIKGRLSELNKERAALRTLLRAAERREGISLSIEQPTRKVGEHA
jgi:hypothetical protein